MPKGHAKNEAEKSRKCRLAALGNQNRLGQRWKQRPDQAFNSGRYQKGRINPFKGKKRPEFMREKNPNWITDRSLVKRREKRNNPEYKQWRQQVWSRDNFKCRIANVD